MHACTKTRARAAIGMENGGGWRFTTYSPPFSGDTEKRRFLGLRKRSECDKITARYSNNARTQLNLEGSIHEQSWSSALKLTISSGHKIQVPKILFQKVAEEEIEKQKEKLQKSGN